ncbi:hypothetical protein ABDJ41_22870 [Pedobacter sp. ASV1-7]|uniref:hypothetical protein n=2 Tax=Pedobacter sp. ASV1-7 TaxID=3145237 RepID=UPI0032E91DF0
MKIRRTLFVLILIIICGAKASAQNTLDLLFNLSSCTEMPCDMTKVEEWIKKSISPLYIANLQYSTSTYGDNNFLSFSLRGRNPVLVPLDGTNGMQLNFATLPPPSARSQKISVLFTQQIRSYLGKVRYDELPQTNEDFFYIAYKMLKLSPGQMIANTLNYEIESDGSIEKLKIFNEMVNKKMKTNIIVPEKAYADINQYLKYYIQTFGLKRINPIYKTFIEQKDSVKTMEKIERFYAVTRFFQGGMKAKIDDHFNPRFNLSLDSTATIDFPVAILKPLNKSDSIARFKFQYLEAKMDYRKKNFVLVFKGKWSSPVTIQAIKQYSYNHKTNVPILIKPVKLPSSGLDFDKIIITLTQNDVTVDGSTVDEYKYQLTKEKWPKASSATKKN